MVKRKISILEPAATSVAGMTRFIESIGLPQTAKKTVDDAFEFFEKLSDERIIHKPWNYKKWHDLKYCCVSYKKKYVVAYPGQEKEIIICDFVSARLLK